ncbi:MAG: transporter substrate-binding domain-containing protein, partial [Agathobaculum sp.]|uniref:transporter substrate-binding domain-containing protein n=1 Tax=Agathobaculum sp. TaxID=2048138 RepID=UPI003D8A5471
MKKLSIAMLSMLLAGSMLLTGCGGNKDTQADAGADTDAGASDETDAGADTAEGGTLVMSTNATFPPYEYYEGDQIVGIDPEIAQAIADKLGMELQINDMDFDPAIAAAQTGQADIVMEGLSVTDERKEKVNFTDSYATGVQVVIVPEDSEIKTLEDMTGKLIGVQQGTTGDIYCSDTPENGGFGEENVQKFTSGPVAVEALK